MKNLILFTLLSVFAFSCKKKDKEKTIRFEYTLGVGNHFMVEVIKNGTRMYGHADGQELVNPQPDGTYKMGSQQFTAIKGDRIEFSISDTYSETQSAQLKIFVDDSQITYTDTDPSASGIYTKYIVE